MIRYWIDEHNRIHLTRPDGTWFIKFPIRVLRQQKEKLIKCFKPEVHKEVRELLYVISDDLKERGLLPM